MSNVNIKSENILAAAAGCSTAKNVLEKLFPEVFAEEAARLAKAKENEKYYDLSKQPDAFRSGNSDFHLAMSELFPNSSPFQIRRSGNFKDKGFCMGHTSFTNNWDLIKDSEGILVLVPTKIKR